MNRLALSALVLTAAGLTGALLVSSGTAGTASAAIQVTGQDAANVAPVVVAPAPTFAANPTVFSVSVDPFGLTMQVGYGAPGQGPSRLASQALLPSEVTAIKAMIGRVMQVDQGWDAAPNVP